MRGHAQRHPREGRPGTEAAGNDAADVGRVDREPELSGLAAGRAVEKEIQKSATSSWPRKFWKKITMGSKKSRSASSNTWRAAVGEESPRVNPVLRRAPGVGQNVSGNVHRTRNGPQFVRVSLAACGMRPKSRTSATYIGALPGQIIQMMKKAGTVNPIFVLDEVDKMSHRLPRRSSAALMEVLRSRVEQRLHGHSLDVEYDLSSHVRLHGQRDAHDSPAPAGRMEFCGSRATTASREKRADCEALPGAKALDRGLPRQNLTFSDQAITHVILHYTHEQACASGAARFSNICARLARRVVKDGAAASRALRTGSASQSAFLDSV